MLISDSGRDFGWRQNLWCLGGTEAKEGVRSLWEEGKASGKSRSSQGQGEDPDGALPWILRTRAFQGGGSLCIMSYCKGGLGGDKTWQLGGM